MNILDIDLDFFLDDIAYYCDATGTDRLDDNFYNPWEASAVRNFLEERCKLSIRDPIKGNILKHHHEVFGYWRMLISKGLLTKPFDIIHIDAHSDLGLGDAGYVYIMGKLLHLPVEDRINENEFNDKIGPGNFLAFALACRWLKSITFVAPLGYQDDLFKAYFKNRDLNSGYIRLEKYSSEKQISNRLIDFIEGTLVPQSYEPEIPFHLVPWDKFYINQPLSFIFLSRSPSFTPRSADVLIPVISEYIKII